MGDTNAVQGDDRPASRPRPRWTASRFVGTPDPPPPYVTEPAFPGLKFTRPLVMASTPATGRLFVGEQGGKVFSFENDPHVTRADVALDLAKERPGMAALYGLAFHPNFAQNRQAYVCYVIRDGTPDGTRVSRFNVSDTNPPRFDAASETILLTYPSGGHNGGCLAFGPEGYLYISTGDAEVPTPPDPRDTGQDVSDLLASILRIDVDHADGGKAYKVPPDNPFVSLKNARPEIWAYGFRNPWRMSFDRKKGDLWVGDVGWELWEMVHRVVKGGNYGWSIVEGHQPVHPEGKRGPTPILPPIVEHPHSEAASITGGHVYRGEKLPALEGAYIYGDFQSGKMWGLRHDGERLTWRGHLADTPLQLVAFGEDTAGELYLLDYERTGQIHRLIPNSSAGIRNQRFPTKLSESGLFTSTASQEPSPGVIPYRINASLWSDGATAERWLALGGVAPAEATPLGIWKLPDGSVLARTVSIETEKGNAKSRRRVETQVLHRESGSWRPYSYVWDDAQQDATLAPAEGVTKTSEVGDATAPGGKRALTYRVSSRSECTLCHNPWVETKSTVFGRQSASPLGLSTGQLNCEIPSSEGTHNQVKEWLRQGLVTIPEGMKTDSLPRTADPYDTSAAPGPRARAYLQVNCAHCHQFNAGGSATILLGEEIPLDRMQALGVKPTQGAFGITDAQIIRPGDPEGSVLLYRVAKLGGGRMPRVGSGVVDEKGVALLGDWIASLPGAGKPANPVTRPIESREIDGLLGSTRGALTLIRAIDRGSLEPALKQEAIARGAKHERGEIRDLFERFIPESERVQRLGETFDAAVVLGLKGDRERGREVFRQNGAAQCKSCHNLEGVGETIGQDLAKIGAKYPKAEMLREIIEPSRTIDPAFATYALETKAGQVFSGLLVEKTAGGVVLRNAQNRLIRVASADIEQLSPIKQSLMPEQLLRDLTAQQAADLLEYLGSMR